MDRALHIRCAPFHRGEHAVKKSDKNDTDRLRQEPVPDGLPRKFHPRKQYVRVVDAFPEVNSDMRQV